jgi:F-type H+-transporting ATPase subunit b
MKVDLTLLLELISFGILLFLLHKFVWSHVVKLLDQRRQHVAKSLKEADVLKQQAEEDRKEAQAHLLETKKKALQIKEEAFLYSEKVKEKKTKQAEEEAVRIQKKARQEMAGLIARAKESLKKYSSDLSFQIAEKIIGAEVDKKRHAKLIEKSLKELNEERELNI